MDLVTILAKEFGKLYEKNFDGYFIAKGVLKISNNSYYKVLKMDYNLKSKVIRDNLSVKICESSIFLADKKNVTLTLTLMKPKSNRNLKDRIENYNWQKTLSEFNIEEGTICKRKFYKKKKCFSKEEITTFCNFVGDFNSIHEGKNSVVPGMMILKYIVENIDKENISFTTLNIRFLEPLFVEEIFNLKIDGDNFFVYSKNKLFIRGEFLNEE